MAEKNNPKDQEPRTQRLAISLKEKAQRLRMAECAAKGGEYIKGQCVK